ncbi:hypothetical protein ACN42_g6841 [Penicillium freii]|uniref:Uncharacterized protein n=1 Tax=Penicillium freii TaxID=48697 RepID=A0A101MGQ3_PENFR|nr:hypothetical protein ACN42_g6841 [Penicillium freii]
MVRSRLPNRHKDPTNRDRRNNSHPATKEDAQPKQVSSYFRTSPGTRQAISTPATLRANHEWALAQQPYTKWIHRKFPLPEQPPVAPPEADLTNAPPEANLANVAFDDGRYVYDPQADAYYADEEYTSYAEYPQQGILLPE